MKIEKLPLLLGYVFLAIGLVEIYYDRPLAVVVMFIAALIMCFFEDKK